MATSAIRYDRSECIGIIPMVVPKLELINIQWQIGGADLVETADDATLNQRPKAFDVLSVNGTNDILAFGVVDYLMR